MNCIKKITLSLLPLIAISWLSIVQADEKGAEKEFNKIRNNPVELRHFLYQFPKGGDLHNHIDGAVYAENMIKWASEDGRCIDLIEMSITFPPCDAENNRPKVADVEMDGDINNEMIDAFSVRNYKLGSISGNQKFFSTFGKFYLSKVGRDGDMLSEITQRSASQNTYYIELMQSWGMGSARSTVNDLDNQENRIDEIATEAIALIDSAENQWKALQGCKTDNAKPACEVKVAYITQVLRTFPSDQVHAQTKLGVRLMQRDPRVIGLTFVAPEDHPVSLKDYTKHMEMVKNETQKLSIEQRNINLHAGELSLGLVTPEDLGFHVREAIEIAGSKRIGHAVDIIYDSNRDQLLNHMAENKIAVEINLTSNDVILDIKGEQHPFNLFRKHNVPLTLSTDDEGVSRIDLTHEYQRAIETYNLSYKDIKHFARNALEYSFQTGHSLFVDYDKLKVVKSCRDTYQNDTALSQNCKSYLETNPKSNLQLNLELMFREFESQY